MLRSGEDRRVDTVRMIIAMADERDTAIAERDAARQEAAKYRKLHTLATKVLGWGGLALLVLGLIASSFALTFGRGCA